MGLEPGFGGNSWRGGVRYRLRDLRLDVRLGEEVWRRGWRLTGVYWRVLWLYTWEGDPYGVEGSGSQFSVLFTVIVPRRLVRKSVWRNRLRRLIREWLRRWVHCFRLFGGGGSLRMIWLFRYPLTRYREVSEVRMHRDCLMLLDRLQGILVRRYWRGGRWR